MIILVRFSHMVYYEDIEGSMGIRDSKVGSMAVTDWD